MNDKPPPGDGAAGWYPDPSGAPGKERRWSGTAWTPAVRGDIHAKPPGTSEVKTTAMPASAKAPTAKSPDSSSSGEGGLLGSVRGAIRKRPIAVASVVAGVFLVLGIAAGAADTTELNDLKDENAGLQRHLDKVSAERDEARGQAETAQADADSAQANAEAALADKTAAVEQREQAVGSTEQTIADNTFSDGIWEVGRDFEPGLYRSEGGPNCYWAKLGMAWTPLPR